MIALILMTLLCSAAFGQEGIDGLPAPGSDVPWLDPELQPAIVRDAVKVKLATVPVPGDFELIRRSGERLDLTLEKALAMPEVFPQKPAAEENEPILEQRTRAQALFVEALDPVAALDGVISRYETFLSQEKLKRESNDYKLGVTVTLAAWLAQARWLIAWSRLIENRPAIEAVLNEADVDAGVPKGAYAVIRDNVRKHLASGLGKLHELEPGREKALQKAFAPDAALAKHRELLEERRRLERLVPKVRPASDPGSWRPQPAWGHPEIADVFVSTTQVHEASADLRTGDILVRRVDAGPRDWGGSGYWNGAGIYAGQGELVTVVDGELAQRRLIDWGHAPAVAALRPLVAEGYRESAIRRAAGRFASSAELIERVYAAAPRGASAIVALFDREYARSTQRLELVWFLDAKTGAAETGRSTEEELRRSWRRPRWVMNERKQDGRLQ